MPLGRSDRCSPIRSGGDGVRNIHQTTNFVERQGRPRAAVQRRWGPQNKRLSPTGRQNNP
jgi:hypothetical protein